MAPTAAWSGRMKIVAQAGELLRHRRNVVVADQDVLVLFLHQFVARRHNHFDDVLAGGQHGSAGPVGIGRVGIRHADRAVRPGRLPGRRIQAGDAGELVHAVVRRRLHLVPVVHAVIALELGVVRQRVGRRARRCCRQSSYIRLVVQREEEEIRVGAGVPALARAVHVGNAIGPEALRPIVQTAGLGGVHQREGLAAIRRRPLLVEVDGDMRNQRLPTESAGATAGRQTDGSRHTRHGPWMPPFSPAAIGLLAEFEERVLSGEALPALGQNPGRIDAAGGTARPARPPAIGPVAIEKPVQSALAQ